MYYSVKLIGLHDQELVIHMCRDQHGDMVEVNSTGGTPVILTREQFERMVTWVNQRFDALGQVVRTVH